MQKVLALLLMLFVCTVYVISIKSDDGSNTNDTMVAEESITLNQRLKEVQDTLKNNYPGTPKDLIDLYNEIIGYQYSEKMTEDYVEDTILAMRMIYTQDLIALNHFEGQVERLKEDILNNQTTKLYITDSSIESIEFTQGNMAMVNVVYDTTLNRLDRTYYMLRENNHWKIHSWEDAIY